MAKTKSAPKLEKIVESTELYISFAEVALEAHRKNISVQGYQLTKENRRGDIIGNSIVVNSFIEDYNADKDSADKLPWGEVLGYNGANRRVKCIRKTDLDKLIKALKKWPGKPAHKPRRKTFKIFSEFSNF